MNIASKATVGLISIVFVVFAVAFAPSASAAEDKEIEALQAQLNSLLAQLSSLQGTTTTTTVSSTRVASTGSNAACPYTWARNLSIGSTGDDVRQLQRFLNGNPRTHVAVSGTGSPGNESSYYGPATASAVSKFQELHAAQILTPLGLTTGTGGFYTSTRNRANSLCQSSSVTVVPTGGNPIPVTQGQVSVSGDALAVTAGNPISDSYVVIGAQRVPFVSIVLTAGSDDVRMEGIKVKRFGLSSSDSFNSVALVDANGVQIGTSKGLNSRNEAILGGNFIVPANRSVALTAVGNMTNDSDDFDSGGIAGLEVVEVTADTSVQGSLPLRGAAHALSESITLQTITIDVDGGGGSIDFNEDTEVAVVKVDLGGSGADKEDAYLRSLILEQTGSADNDEVGDIEVFVDDDQVNHRITIDRDRYIITFSGQGVLIEEGDRVDITLEANTDIGSTETIQFEIEDEADIYIVGAEYGYGLPVNDITNSESEETTISSGKVRAGGRFDFDDEVSYGDDKVIGAFSVEFEGEDVDMEDLTFKVTFDDFHTGAWDADDNAWEDAEEDSVSLDNVRLRVDGENVSFADDGNIEFDEPDDADAIVETGVDFSDSFTIDVRGDREVVFEIVADLDDSWSHFDGSTLEFVLTKVDMAEGVSSEKDYTESGEYFALERTFKEVEVIGNQVSFAITNDGVDEDVYVAGSDEVVFGTFEIDADEAIDDVEINDLYISFSVPADDGDNPVGDLGDIDNCRVLDRDGDEVADSRGSLSGKKVAANTEAVTDQVRFRFDRYTVDKGEEAELDIVCDIDDNATEDDEYLIDAVVASNDRVKYTINRDDTEYDLTANDDSDSISVSSGGTLDVSVDSPGNDSVVAVAVGSGIDDVELLEVTVEAEGEDINIKAIYFGALTFGVTKNTKDVAYVMDEDTLSDLFDRMTMEIDGKTVTARPGDFSAAAVDLEAEYGVPAINHLVTANNIAFERIERVVEADEEMTFTLMIDYRGLDDDVDRTLSGNWLDPEMMNMWVVYEGETSNATGVVKEGSLDSDFVKNMVFPTTLQVSADDDERSLSNGDKKLYEFTVAADDAGDIYLNQVGLNFNIGGVTLANGDIKIGGGSVIGATKVAIGSSSGTFTFEFEEPERIRSGESKNFEVYAAVTGAGDSSDYVTVELATDSSRTVVGREYLTSLGNFIWSPNTLDLDDAVDASDDNYDWFNSYGLFDGDDVDSWTSD